MPVVLMDAKELAYSLQQTDVCVCTEKIKELAVAVLLHVCEPVNMVALM